MPRTVVRALVVTLSIVLGGESLVAQDTQAILGSCPLELGGRIEDCRLTYRTFGKLAADRRNAILIPTWFVGRIDDWVPLLGPSGFVDTTQYFVVVVESLGAATSSSPSTSISQHGSAFPEITVSDMVEATYRLSKDQLQLPELYGVVGISFGGFQAFEWGVDHPDYVRRIVAINGTPHQARYGHAIWELLTRTAEDGLRGTVPIDSTAVTLARFVSFVSTSPSSANQLGMADYQERIAKLAKKLRGADLYAWVWQGRAVQRHDIARNFGGDLVRAAAAWRARTLIVVATQDHLVD